MKRLPATLLFIGALAFQTFGQGAGISPAASAMDMRFEIRQLNLSPKEIKAINEVVDSQAASLAKAASEMRIVQAKLERLLLDTDPDMGAIKQLLKTSLDWELEARLARIERAIDLRKLLGPERWARLQKIQRDYLQLKRSGKLRPGELGDKSGNLADLLDRLE